MNNDTEPLSILKVFWIIENWDTFSPEEIIEITGVSIHQLYGIAMRYNLISKKPVPIFEGQLEYVRQWHNRDKPPPVIEHNIVHPPAVYDNITSGYIK